MNDHNLEQIKFHLDSQENLLQNYRSVAVTHQALTAAIVMVMVSVIENYKDIREFFKEDHAYSVMTLILLLTLQITVIIYGKQTTDVFKIQTARRENNINILQHIMKIEESGYLEKEMKKVIMPEKIPISSIFQLIGNKYKNVNPDTEYIQFTDEQIEFIKSITNINSRKSDARKKFPNVLFNIFEIIWVFSFVYFIIKCCIVLKTCIDYISHIG